MADQASPTLESADLEMVDGAEEAVVAEALEGSGIEAAATDAAAATAATDPATTAATEPAEQGLLSELARAMHEAATAQYERQNAELERRRSEQVEAIARRADADVEELNAMSEAEIASIDAWAKTKTEKIKQERLRRIAGRRDRLATQLDHRAAIREREVVAIEAAIDAHRHEVDQFFGRMERETDPAAIARVAATMPAFPALGEIAEAARAKAAAEFATLEAAAATEGLPTSVETVATIEGDADATVTESRLMAVMDPDATRLDAVAERPWDAPYAVSVAAGQAPASAEPSDAPVAVRAPAAEHGSRVGSTLLRTVRAIRPASGERHEGDDRPA